MINDYYYYYHLYIYPGRNCSTQTHTAKTAMLRKLLASTGNNNKNKKNKKKNIAQTKQTFNFCLSLILDCIELNLNITPFKGAPGPANIVNSKIIDISYIYSHRFGSCSLYVYHDSKILLQDPCTLTHLGSHSCH